MWKLFDMEKFKVVLGIICLVVEPSKFLKFEYIYLKNIFDIPFFKLPSPHIYMIHFRVNLLSCRTIKIAPFRLVIFWNFVSDTLQIKLPSTYHLFHGVIVAIVSLVHCIFSLFL